MVAANRTSRKTKPKRIVGIVRMARELGVSRQHLWAVLTQRRESQPLLARVRAIYRT